MPNWIAITIATLKEAKVAALIEACDEAALGSGQDNRATGLIQGVVDEVRRKVASCANNQVDADPTKIPKGLRDIAVDMIIARLKGAIEQDLSEDERNQLSRHERSLNRVAECKDVVDQPDDAVEPEVSSGGAAKLLNTDHPYGQLGST